jgi:hypothetical protein
VGQVILRKLDAVPVPDYLKLLHAPQKRRSNFTKKCQRPVCCLPAKGRRKFHKLFGVSHRTKIRTAIVNHLFGCYIQSLSQCFTRFTPGANVLEPGILKDCFTVPDVNPSPAPSVNGV